MLHGLEHGFWPNHSGDFSGTESLYPQLAQEDDDFLANDAQLEFNEGCLSPPFPFPSLLPHMLVSPSYASYVSRPLDRKARKVFDQSGSGLSDVINRADAKTIYDAIAELGAHFRWLARLDSHMHVGTLWKSDVSRAFRNFPVAREWQVKQVHRVRVEDGRGRHKFVFTVD